MVFVYSMSCLSFHRYSLYFQILTEQKVKLHIWHIYDNFMFYTMLTLQKSSLVLKRIGNIK